MAGDAWIRDYAYAGPFVGVKHMIEQAQFSGQAVAGGLYITGLNVNIIRLADVYLMAAECNIETGALGEAMRLVNLVRARAALLPGKEFGGAPAAAYKVAPYTVFASADYARNAVRFERRLELAMEGHRFYDLVRWGIAKQVIEGQRNLTPDTAARFAKAAGLEGDAARYFAELVVFTQATTSTERNQSYARFLASAAIVRRVRSSTRTPWRSKAWAKRA